MLSDKKFTYYQPQALPEELFSFQAFPTREECEAWLQNNRYEPDDFCINEYHDDDIEEVTLIDRNGDMLLRIEELEEDGLVNLIGDEVLLTAGSIDNLHATRQSNETEDQFKDRVYSEALDAVNDAIVTIEESGEYNFQSYCGTPDVEWYDNARDWAVQDVMNWMLEDYPY